MKRGRSFCVPKASLLCALGRASGIPSRVGLADVRNHLATKQLIDFIGSNLFVYHGFVEFYLEGKWVKATPAFNSSLCRRHKVLPLEFNGREDSLFQPYKLDNQKFMEYIKFHGLYADVPVDEIVAAWKKAYGEERVQAWIRSSKRKVIEASLTLKKKTFSLNRLNGNPSVTGGRATSVALNREAKASPTHGKHP